MSSSDHISNELLDLEGGKGDKATCSEAESQPAAVSIMQLGLFADVENTKGDHANRPQSPCEENRTIFDEKIKEQNRHLDQQVTRMILKENQQVTATNLHLDSTEQDTDQGIVRHVGHDIETLSDVDHLEEEQVRQALAASNNFVSPGAVSVTPGGRRVNDSSSEMTEDESSGEFSPDTSNEPEADYHHVLTAEKVDEEEERKRLQEPLNRAANKSCKIYARKLFFYWVCSFWSLSLSSSQ